MSLIICFKKVLIRETQEVRLVFSVDKVVISFRIKTLNEMSAHSNHFLKIISERGEMEALMFGSFCI